MRPAQSAIHGRSLSRHPDPCSAQRTGGRRDGCRDGQRRPWFTILAFTLILALAPPASAQTSSPPSTPTPPVRPDSAADLLENARRALEAATTALERSGQGRARLAALGEAVRAQESALAAYRGAARLLARRAQDLTAGIAAERDRIGELVALLQSFNSAPRSALFAYPGGPVRAARAAMLMAAVAPALEERRTALAAELDRLRQIRAAEASARDGATAALSELQALRAETAIALEERRASLPPQRLVAAQARNAARNAESLGQLAETLERLLGEVPAAPGFEERRGRLALPVRGRISAGFGDADPWGNPGAGITVTAEAFAEVQTPVDATLRYAGPLPGYGLVAILEPEPGWLITLAGLGHIDRTVGETVLRGERLGDMGGPLPQNTQFAPSPGADSPAPEARADAPQAPLPDLTQNLLEQNGGSDLIVEAGLYIEVRQEGVPVDPAPWFTKSDRAAARP